MCVLVNDHVYVCVRGIEFPSFYDFNILFCNCSDSFSFVCVFVLIIYDSIEYTSRDDVFVLILYDSIEYTSRDDVFVLILYDSIEYTSRDDVFVLILYDSTLPGMTFVRFYLFFIFIILFYFIFYI